jgi:hypothetical protein
MGNRKKPTYTTSTTARPDAARKLRLARDTLKYLATSVQPIGSNRGVALTAKCVTFTGPVLR